MSIGFLLAMASLLSSAKVEVQSLSVLPVQVAFKADEATAALTLVNESKVPASVQIHASAWGQSAEGDVLTDSTALRVSPPFAVIPAGTAQIVRLTLDRPRRDHETSYRIIVDQIPPPPVSGTVHVALRLSIPVFVEPWIARLKPMRFEIERRAGAAWLVGTNDGVRHRTLRDMKLLGTGGETLGTMSGTSPYVLAGVTRRWLITPQGSPLVVGERVRLTAADANGRIDVPLTVTEGQ